MALPFQKRLKSFHYAFRGLATLLRTQANTRIHLGATLVAGMAGIYFSISRLEWALLVIAVALVWITEALNTSIEFLGDALSLEPNKRIGQAKDVAAGAVLIAAIASIVIGTCIFLPHLLAIFRS